LAGLGGVEDDREVLLGGGLAHEVVQVPGPQRPLELLVLCRRVGVQHAVRAVVVHQFVPASVRPAAESAAQGTETSLKGSRPASRFSAARTMSSTEAPGTATPSTTPRS